MKGTGSVIELFFHLIRCGIGKAKELPHTPSESEWGELFEIAKKQTLAGVAFAGIQQLPPQQRPPKVILLQWHSLCMVIKRSNADLDKKCALVSQKFKSEGFESCILKGQGIAQLYPDPSLRTPGDIDIWVDGGDNKVIAYVKKYIPDYSPTYHHVDFPISSDVHIEIHYRPSWMCNPFNNKRIQEFFGRHSKKQFNNMTETSAGVFPAATTEFNRIFILQHIFRHLFFEGIGIRQILDYYFVMQQPMTEKEKREYTRVLKSIGLYKFAGAVNYAMQYMFDLDDVYCIIKPNKKEGEFLLNEILSAGNFGKYDKRYISTERGLNAAHIINLTKRTVILLSHYPTEMLWDPFFRVWHYFWRKRH